MKPDKDRLKELKFEYMKLYQNGYIKLPLLDELLALIDAALTEPDADVAEAIDDITERIEWECTVHGTKARQDKLKMYDLELQALRQYQKPTDEAVQRAIEELRLGENAWGRGYVFAPTPYTVALAITALLQMGSTEHSTDSTSATGCEICGNFKRVDCRADNLEFTAVYCPNCGRKLVK